MPSLAATYTSPSTASPETFASALPALSPPPSPQDRVAYLAALHAALRALQGDINTFLTQKMEADKAAGATKGDDAQAEETYGEEVVDED